MPSDAVTAMPIVSKQNSQAGSAYHEASVLQRGGAVLLPAMEAGDEVINELRNCGVLADDDEARRHLDAPVLPEFESLLVVAVEGLQRRLQAGGELERVEFLAFATPLVACPCECSSQELRNIGISSPGMFSATGTRGNLTIPHSMASISEKSLMVHGNKVPST